LFFALGVVCTTFLSTGPASAQEYQLFDKFSFALEGSWAAMDTIVRLDSDLGEGTELNFENDGGLAKSTVVPTLSFEWMMGRRHRLAGWWMNIDRNSTDTILQEIKWGDVVFPIDEEVRFLLGNDEIALSYTYMLVLKDRHAFGLGGGLRTVRTTMGLATVEAEISEEGDFTAPLPFINVEYRYGLGEKWRLISDLGVFYVEIGDYAGGQYVLDGWVEYLASRRVAIGAGARGTLVDAEMATGTIITGDFFGQFKSSVVALRLFFRLRF
jgi:hypothetical protein